MAPKRRLDAELVRRRLASSRAQAVDLIGAGAVLVSGAAADKPSRLVGADEPVVIIGPPPPYVSRAGGKLQAALTRFGIEVSGRRALDAGASTGGFTDCLLQQGAESVIAIDVGRAQLHEKLRSDRRVDVREQTDIRSVTPADIGGPVDLVVADLAFISLRSVAQSLVGLVAPEGALVVLVKPQFEVGRKDVSKGKGVIRDPLLWRQALDGAVTALSGAGAAMMGVMVSPMRGTDGNVEFLLYLGTVEARPDSLDGASLERALTAAVDAAAGES